MLVLVTYHLDPADRRAAAALLHQLAEHRRGDGASGWGVTEDTANPGVLVEWFTLPSWQEHLRQHHRHHHHRCRHHRLRRRRH